MPSWRVTIVLPEAFLSSKAAAFAENTASKGQDRRRFIAGARQGLAQLILSFPTIEPAGLDLRPSRLSNVSSEVRGKKR